MSFNLGTAAGKIIIDGSQAKAGFGVAQTAATAFYGAVQERLDSVKQLGTNLTRVGTAGSAGLGLAIRSAANFEATLSGVKAVSGATAAQMDEIRKAALRIGKDTVFSAGEAAQAIQELSKAGVSTTDILNGAADATVSLAAAGSIDLPQAATIAANAMNNFALTGKQLPHVADLIAGAANASAIDVSDFGFSLSQAGAVAHLTGLSFDDLSVAIAEMGQAGIKGSDAGTSIKTFLTNLIPTTAQQTKMFRELGLITVRTGKGFQDAAKLGIKPLSNSYTDVTKALQKYVAANGGGAEGTAKNAAAANKMGQQLNILGNNFFDAQGNMKSFSEVQQVLQTATKGMTKEQKLNTLQVLFGSDAIRASAVFAEQGAKGFTHMADAMGKVTAADVAKTRMDNLNGSIENLKGSFETMMITIGEVFLPFVRKVVDGVNKMVNVFNNLPAPMQKAIAIFFGLGSVMSLFTGIAIKLAFFLVPMLAHFLGFSALKGIFGIFLTGFKIWRTGAGAAAALAASIAEGGIVFTRFARIGRILFGVLSKFPLLFRIMRATAAFAFGPWGVALLAVAAAAFFAFKKIKPFHDLVVNIASAIRSLAIKALNELALAFHAFIGAVQQGDVTSDGFIGKIEKVGSIVHLLFVELQNLVALFKANVIPALHEAGRQIKAALGDAFAELAKTFRENLLPALNQLKQTLVEQGPAIRKLWTEIQPLVKIIAGVLVVAIIEWTLAIIKVATFIIGTLIPALIVMGTIITIVVIKAITLVISFIINLIAFIIQVAEVIVNVWVASFQLLQTVASAVLTFLIALVKGAIGIIVAAIQAGAALAVALWQQWWGAFGGILTAVTKFWIAVIGLALAVILLAITRAADLMIKVWRFLWNEFLLVIRTVWGVISPFISAAVKAAAIVISAAWALIRNITSASWAAIKAAIIGPLTAAGAFINSKLNAAANAVRAAWNRMVALTRSAFSAFFGATSSGTNRAMAPITNIRKRVIGALSGAGGWLVSAGRAIIQGLINGINSATAGVRNALGNITNLLPSWKGPMEKDRKLLTANGEAILRSLLPGFQKALPDIRSWLQGMTMAIPQTVSVNQTVQTNAARPSNSQIIPARGPSEGVTVNNHWNVYNPVAEKTSVTTTKAATRRAQLGVLG